ncbi:hypothetical protein K438DRAFT_2028083 [Mycena galopus ATCC 62051]|nr:hypothetical protein K438DRAFT_2028083 [Mycena galopus ATCC 62051]
MPSFIVALFAATLFLPITCGAFWSRHPRNVSLLDKSCLSSVYTPVTTAVCLSSKPAVVQSQFRSGPSYASTLNPRLFHNAGGDLGHENFGPTHAASPMSKPASTLTAAIYTPSPVPAPPTPPPTATSVAPGALSLSVPPNEGGAPNSSNGNGLTATTSNRSVDAATKPTAASRTSSSSGRTANLNDRGSSTPARSPLATSVPAGTPASSGGATNPDSGSGSTQTQTPLATSVPAGAAASSGGANTKGGSGPARWMHLITFGVAMGVLLHCI